MLYLAVAGPIAAMALGIARQVEFVHVADKFVQHPQPAVTAATKAHLAHITNPQQYLSAVKDLSQRGHADSLLKGGGVKLIAEIGLVANISVLVRLGIVIRALKTARAQQSRLAG